MRFGGRNGIAMAAVASALFVGGSAVTADAAEGGGGPRTAAPAADGRGYSLVRDVVLAVHGGAGSLVRGSISAERERAYRAGLEKALRAGHALLKGGKSSLDAVEASVRVLEDDPNFNAGKGAVFNTDAEHELDASIMNGEDLRSGAVAGVRNTKNPISLARMVMERSRHVLLAGPGADTFALRNGVPYTTQDYFHTDRRWRQLLDAKGIPADGRTADAPQAPADAPKTPAGAPKTPGDAPKTPEDAGTARPGASQEPAGAAKAGGPVGEFGTVGAVAVDRDEELAAATSTGGLTNKLVGRVGDSPIIGAGTYANSRTVAISCTGTGEVFIRGVAAYDVSALMEYTRAPVQQAAAKVITEKIPALGATGGAIALDPRGVLATPHSTAGLINGYITRDGKVVTRIYDDETPPR
ncbi:isoaspartyl peptidase/L-asparaginase family protein [Bailinhaonella thermotolerans]|uniref:Isoaspartyl peptidase/L-asparaginase n=1 Tax=Bailinhaonella thermotolerans TaxID=1070861 RepID=A0A3A4A3C5_9ACTN|nr:isoaspartyl peptidase/L-asparaginase [Bailinhaonella thermotolerans]RJL22102.1 isoaspartyl peptidase/L-asparaginase [Bailinhaonella thermotolerans]